MRRAMVRHGDPTTTGGFVMAFSSTMFDDGRRIALHGDDATCGNCEGSFKIFGSGTEATENGRATVLHGDPVMCPCGKNKVFVGSDPGCHVENGTGTVRTSSAANAVQPAIATALVAPVVGRPTHTQWCFVSDSVTGEPLPYRDFVALVGGVKQSGKTDSEGYAKIETDGEQPFNIHFTFSSPKRALKPRQGD